MKYHDKCICGTDKAKVLFRTQQYFINVCDTCEQVRTIANRKLIRKHLYSHSDIAVYLEKEKMFRFLFQKIVHFIQNYKADGNFIDIGAGVGLLVDEAKIAGFNSFGFELSKAAVKAAEKRFGITLIQSEFKLAEINKIGLQFGLQKDHRNSTADIVVINHVLEHIPDPKKMIKLIHVALRSGGYLFIGVPNFGSLMALLKKARWQSLIPDQHRWHFTLKTLDNLVIPFGFIRQGLYTENHNRSMHPFWKQPFYSFLDKIALYTNRGEAMFVAYRKL